MRKRVLGEAPGCRERAYMFLHGTKKRVTKLKKYYSEMVLRENQEEILEAQDSSVERPYVAP